MDTSPAVAVSVRRASLLAFATAMVVVATQVLVARIVSAKLLNNYAFFVISLTMLGFAFSGVLLSRCLPALVKRLSNSINWCSGSFVISTLLVTGLFYHVGLGTQKFATRGEFISSFLSLAPLALLYGIPFGLSGFILGMLLALPQFPVRRIYCFDLIGSACGAVSVLPAISAWGVEHSLVVACALQWSAGAFLAPPRGCSVRVYLGLALLGLAGSLAFSKPWFAMCHRDQSVLAATQQPGTGFILEQVTWDPVARIEVTRIPPPNPQHLAFPALIGDNPAFLARFKKIITQNNFAFTYALEYDGRKSSLQGIEDTIYAAAYQAAGQTNLRAGILGVGGGFDVLTALYFDAAHVTAIEINAATVTMLKERFRDYFKAWVEDPRVQLVQAEGRHYLSSRPGQFDVLQLSGVDSYSGTPGAANVFSENYLYTAEAFDLYLDRLSDRGILNMMRLEHRPPREMLRALITAVAALRRAGVQTPSQHIMMLTSNEGNFTAMLVKKTAFSDAEEQRVMAWTSTNRFFKVSAAPHWNPSEKNFYQQFLELNDPGAEQAYFEICPFNVKPATDDRPFFFRFSYWWHLWTKNSMVSATVPALEISLIILGLLAAAAAAVCIGLPLRFLTQVGAPPAGGWRYALVFAATAVGYMMIEIALMQKFGLFLGHPNYALSIVLAALLLATGLGSLWSARIVGISGGLKTVSYLLTMVLLLEQLLILPHLANWQSWPLPMRAGLVGVLVFPLGILMGTFVPSALDGLKASGRARWVAWCWGITGIFSVLAPVLSIALSVTAGISALLLSAIPVYLLAGFALPSVSSSAVVLEEPSEPAIEALPGEAC